MLCMISENLHIIGNKRREGRRCFPCTQYVSCLSIIAQAIFTSCVRKACFLCLRGIFDFDTHTHSQSCTFMIKGGSGGEKNIYYGNQQAILMII